MPIGEIFSPNDDFWSYCPEKLLLVECFHHSSVENFCAPYLNRVGELFSHLSLIFLTFQCSCSYLMSLGLKVCLFIVICYCYQLINSNLFAFFRLVLTIHIAKSINLLLFLEFARNELPKGCS